MEMRSRSFVAADGATDEAHTDPGRRELTEPLITHADHSHDEGGRVVRANDELANAGHCGNVVVTSKYTVVCRCAWKIACV
jgi:hypothetical protein